MIGVRGIPETSTPRITRTGAWSDAHQTFRVTRNTWGTRNEYSSYSRSSGTQKTQGTKGTRGTRVYSLSSECPGCPEHSGFPHHPGYSEFLGVTHRIRIRTNGPDSYQKIPPERKMLGRWTILATYQLGLRVTKVRRCGMWVAGY